MSALHGDAVIACADLVGRAGASGVEIAWTCPHVPDEPADHNCPDVTWNATAAYRGARIMTAEHQSPTLAAMALAERLLAGATCRCGKAVTLADGRPGCRWTLTGKQWAPGCDVEPIHVKGQRGDHAAMTRALTERTGRKP